MDEAQTAAVAIIEAMTDFTSRYGIDNLLDILEGVQLAYESFGSEDRAVAEIETVTVQ